MNIGDRYEYKGKFYHFIGPIKVKMFTLEKGEGFLSWSFCRRWVDCIEYYNSEGKYAREKVEFFKRFKPC